MFHRHMPRPCLALWLLAALALGCKEQPAPTKPSTSAEVSAGDRPFELDVVAVRDCETPRHAPLENDEMLLGVKVKLRARRDQTPQNYFYASLVDSEGRRYAPSFSGCTPRLVGEPLAATQTATGFVNFRLPRDARGLTLEYAPRIGHTNKARGTLLARDLGR